MAEEVTGISAEQPEATPAPLPLWNAVFSAMNQYQQYSSYGYDRNGAYLGHVLEHHDGTKGLTVYAPSRCRGNMQVDTLVRQDGTPYVKLTRGRMSTPVFKQTLERLPLVHDYFKVNVTRGTTLWQPPNIEPVLFKQWLEMALDGAVIATDLTNLKTSKHQTRTVSTAVTKYAKSAVQAYALKPQIEPTLLFEWLRWWGDKPSSTTLWEEITRNLKYVGCWLAAPKMFTCLFTANLLTQINANPNTSALLLRSETASIVVDALRQTLRRRLDKQEFDL
jgi:hypothetical protein